MVTELLERIPKFFGIGLTKGEKIARVERWHNGLTLVNKILEIEGL